LELPTIVVVVVVGATVVDVVEFDTYVVDVVVVGFDTYVDVVVVGATVVVVVEFDTYVVDVVVEFDTYVDVVVVEVVGAYVDVVVNTKGITEVLKTLSTEAVPYDIFAVSEI